MIFRFIPLFLVLQIQSIAWAASGTVPTLTVYSQIINFSLLVGAIYFFQRKAIAQFFTEKKESYLKKVNDASESKLAAELKLAEVTLRVEEIERTFQEQIREAHKNADKSYHDQVEDARFDAVRIKESANLSLEMEVLKQIENLRVETYQKSAGLAERNLEKNLTPAQLSAWNDHFIQGKEGVH